MNKKQRQEELGEILELCDFMEYEIYQAIKTRILQCNEKDLPGDELCNLLFNISRQANLIDYRLAILMGE